MLKKVSRTTTRHISIFVILSFNLPVSLAAYPSALAFCVPSRQRLRRSGVAAVADEVVVVVAVAVADEVVVAAAVAAGASALPRSPPPHPLRHWRLRCCCCCCCRY